MGSYIHYCGFLYIVPCVVLGPFSFLALALRSADLLGHKGEREKERRRQKMRKKEDLEEHRRRASSKSQEEQQAKFVKLAQDENNFGLSLLSNVDKSIEECLRHGPDTSQGARGERRALGLPSAWASAPDPGCAPRRPLSARPGRPGGAADPGTQSESTP